MSIENAMIRRVGSIAAMQAGGRRRLDPFSPEAVERRLRKIGNDAGQAHVLDETARATSQACRRNIERYIGTVKVPIGLAGPLKVNGGCARGSYHLPLATTEAALVASYHRGARLITAAGGCTARVLKEGVSRSPGFAFRNLVEVETFLEWVDGQLANFRRVAQSTTRYGKLTAVRPTVEGNHVYLECEFVTGDASGQNMVTIATEAICTFVLEHTPAQPQYFFLEANHSGDKKATSKALGSVRGRRVCAEVEIPAELVWRMLHTEPTRMSDYARMATTGAAVSGAIGLQGHYANGLAALYLACGQDVACVAESAVGITRLEVTDSGSLYAAVTLPNIMVGTVGGGTHLPSQKGCLDIMGLAGPGKSGALAEICGGLVLAGELSLVGALCAGEFANAHKRLARGVSPRIAAPMIREVAQ